MNSLIEDAGYHRLDLVLDLWHDLIIEGLAGIKGKFVREDLDRLESAVKGVDESSCLCYYLICH